jgi:hypothetical protein
MLMRHWIQSGIKKAVTCYVEGWTLQLEMSDDADEI